MKIDNFFAELKRRNVYKVAVDCHGSATCFPERSRAMMAIVNRFDPRPKLSVAATLSPFKAVRWLELTPAERLRRSWALRKRLPDLQAVHDRKLFPKP